MVNSVAVLSLIVAVIYFIIGLLIMPSIRLSLKALLGAGLFFVGCALTHTHLAVDLLTTGPEMHHFSLMALYHVMQIVGGFIFIAELRSKRLIVVLRDHDA